MRVLMRTLLLSALFILSVPLSQVYGGQTRQEKAAPREQRRSQKRELDRKKQLEIVKQVAKEAKAGKKKRGAKKRPPLFKRNRLHARCLGTSSASNPSTAYTVEVAKNGSTIILADGTTWNIRECYHDTVTKWGDTSKVIFSTNQDYLNQLMKDPQDALRYKYRFQATNTRRNESVEVELSQGPFLFSADAVKINRINRDNNSVYLTDGHCYRIADTEANNLVLRGWKRDDFVVVGQHASFLWMGYPFLIINLSAGANGDCAAATCTY